MIQYFKDNLQLSAFEDDTSKLSAFSDTGGNILERKREIEYLLGQSVIFNAITECETNSANYLIEAPSGRGKHYLSKLLLEHYSGKRNIRVLHCHINRPEVNATWDFAPFIGLLAEEENLAKVNYTNVGKPFIELIPYVGKCITQLMSQKKVYSATFNSIETELLTRLTRVIGILKPVFLCENIDLWDKASSRFLQKLLATPITEKGCIFICTSGNNNAESPIEHTQFTHCFEIRTIAEEDMAYVVKTLFRGVDLAPELLRQIHQLSGGNIGIICQLVELIGENESGVLNASRVYHDVILHQLRENLSEPRYNRAVELLDKASLVGERVYRKLLQHFLQYDPVIFTESVGDVVTQNIMTQSVDELTFTYRAVWQSFYAVNVKNRKFHHELAKCIHELMPSNYSYIADELLKAGEDRAAAIYYILAALNEYHTYRAIPVLPIQQKELLDRCGLRTDYQQLIELYSYYFAGNYEATRQTMCRCKEPQLAFEVDYIKAVAQINGSILQSAYAEALVNLQSWVEDENFCSQSPHQWMRAALLAIGAQYELHDKSMVSLLKRIEQTKRKYAATDRGIEWLEYDFLSKCNYCYTVDTAYHYTKEAVRFFEKNLLQAPSKYPYYVALINSGANSTVVGKYQEAIDFLTKAIEFVEQESVSHGIVDSLINNLLIAELLGGQINTAEEIQLAIEQIDPLIEAMSGDTISQILLRNNQAVMMCYQGDIATATEKIDKLYTELRYIDDVDDYYPYIVGNNYYIIKYLAGLAPIDRHSMEEVFRFRPLDHDHNYFSTRQRIILEQIEKGLFPDLSMSDWNRLPGPFVGPAWSFWGRWLLFSDMQIWSD